MPMFRRSMALLLLLAAIAAGWTMYTLYGEDRAQPLTAGAVQAGGGENIPSDLRQIAVYVTGEVRSPGVVYVPFDGRVADAVNACGGVLPTADLNRVNMAQTVKDGLHVKVPEKQAAAEGRGPVGGGEGRAAAASEDAGGRQGNDGSRQGNDGGGKGGGKQADSGGDTVNINTADADGLTKLKGIGPAMARRIVEYREENGPFQSPEELQRVKGIGRVKFAKLQEQIAL